LVKLNIHILGASMANRERSGPPGSRPGHCDPGWAIYAIDEMR